MSMNVQRTTQYRSSTYTPLDSIPNFPFSYHHNFPSSIHIQILHQRKTYASSIPGQSSSISRNSKPKTWIPCTIMITATYPIFSSSCISSKNGKRRTTAKPQPTTPKRKNSNHWLKQVQERATPKAAKKTSAKQPPQS